MECPRRSPFLLTTPVLERVSHVQQQLFPSSPRGPEIRILSDLVVILIAALDRKSTDRKTRRRSSRPDPLDQEDLGLASYGVSLSRAALHRRHPTHTRAVCRVATTTLGAPIRHRTRCARISHPRIRTRATHDAGPRALSHSPRPNPYLRVLAARATVLARIS